MAKRKQAIQLSAKSVEHYTPTEWADRIRLVFGGPIHLDPFSHPQANLLIGAERYYTEAEDGLAQPWFGNTWVNPPGGRIKYQGKNHNRAALCWATTALRYSLGHIPQAGFMVFNFELFRFAQGYQTAHPLDFPICILKKRIDFYKPGPDGRPIKQGQPGHPNAIVYLGQNVAAFRSTFGPFGKVHNT